MHSWTKSSECNLPTEGKGDRDMQQTVYPSVLLNDAVDQFDQLIGRFDQHAVAAGEEIYIQPSVYLSLHLVQMRTAGWADMDFDTLAAVSGASALFAHQRGDFMPKYANLYIGMDERITGATGFGYEWVSFEDADSVWDLVRESVDVGQPVKGWHWENILFAGYRDAVEIEGRRVFALADGPDTFAAWWTWQEFQAWVNLVANWGSMALGWHTECVETTHARDVAWRVIQDLVAWSTNPPPIIHEKYPEADLGLAGIEAYASDCANTEQFEEWLLCHDINPQWTVRNSTAVYLQHVAEAGMFPQKITQHLTTAAKEYWASYNDWHNTYKLLGHAASEVALRSTTHREAGATLIRKALGHERRAIGELEKALAAAD